MQRQDSQLAEPTWPVPGPGAWTCEASHFPRPVSATVAGAFQAFNGRMSAACERYGLPIDGFVFETVHGWAYSTIGVPPPDVVAGREQAAMQVVQERPWLDDVRSWTNLAKPQWVARNLALQARTPASLGDAELASLLRDLTAALAEGGLLHFELH